MDWAFFNRVLNHSTGACSPQLDCDSSCSLCFFPPCLPVVPHISPVHVGLLRNRGLWKTSKTFRALASHGAGANFTFIHPFISLLCSAQMVADGCKQPLYLFATTHVEAIFTCLVLDIKTWTASYWLPLIKRLNNDLVVVEDYNVSHFRTLDAQQPTQISEWLLSIPIHQPSKKTNKKLNIYLTDMYKTNDISYVDKKLYNAKRFFFFTLRSQLA